MALKQLGLRVSVSSRGVKSNPRPYSQEGPTKTFEKGSEDSAQALLCPEGAFHTSPGQRPGLGDAFHRSALKGRAIIDSAKHFPQELDRPFRAPRCGLYYPGRCPGLGYCAPSGHVGIYKERLCQIFQIHGVHPNQVAPAQSDGCKNKKTLIR